MIKALFSSIFIHIVVVGSVLFYLPNSSKKSYADNSKKISISHVVIKKEKAKSVKKVVQKRVAKKKKIVKQAKAVVKKEKIPKVKSKTIKNKKHAKKSLHKKQTHTRIKKKKEIKKRKYTKYKQHKQKVKKVSKKEYKKQTKIDNFLYINKSKIYQAIQRAKSYPPMAKRLNIQGIVNVNFTLLPNGKIINIVTSKADAILQKAAKKTIIKASKEFPRPKSRVGVSLDISYTF